MLTGLASSISGLSRYDHVSRAATAVSGLFAGPRLTDCSERSQARIEGPVSCPFCAGSRVATRCCRTKTTRVRGVGHRLGRRGLLVLW